MKVCLINNLYKPYNRGGAERIVELTAAGLKENGHEVAIISTKPLLEQGNGSREPGVYYLKSFYYNLDKMPKFFRLFWHLFDILNVKSFFKIRSILKKEKCDLAITHNLTGIGFLTSLSVKSLKIKHIHVLHDIQLLHPSGLMMFGKEKIIGGFPAKIYQNLCRCLFGSPAAVISPSKWLSDLHVKNNFFRGSKKIIQPNPVVLSNRRLIKKQKSGDIIFLYIGQIEEHKGILFLASAFRRAVQNNKLNPNSRLIIAGSGSASEKLASLIKDCGKIEFTGRIAGAEVENLMRLSDVLIVPSLCYENSPTVIYEAFSAGLPVVGSDLGGIAELLQTGGVLFKPEDENDLIDKLIYSAGHITEMNQSAEQQAAVLAGLGIKEYANKIINL